MFGSKNISNCKIIGQVMLKKWSAVIAVMTLFVGSAHSTLLEFDILYDGTNQYSQTGSRGMAGTEVFVGDQINLDVTAKGQDYWLVTADSTWVLDNALQVQQSGTRTINSTIEFYFDNVLQHSHSVWSENQSYVHLGGPNYVPVFDTLKFDQVTINIDLLSSTASTIIRYDYLTWNWWSNDSEVSYVQVIDVSEPWIISLFVLSLILMRRNRR